MKLVVISFAVFVTFHMSAIYESQLTPRHVQRDIEFRAFAK